MKARDAIANEISFQSDLRYARSLTRGGPAMGDSRMNSGFAQATTLGFSRLKELRFGGAIAAFRRAVLIDPSQTIAAYGAGFCEMRRSNWRIAIILLSRAALTIHAGTRPRIAAELHIALGHCRKTSGLLEEAGRSFQRGSIVEPSNGQIYFNHSNCVVDRYSDRFLLRLATRAAITAPRTADYWNGLGGFLANRNALKNSEIAYRRTLVLCPGHHHAWDNLGILHKRKDEIRAGIRCFWRAHRIDPDNEQPLLNLGRNLLLIGDLAEGWRCLERPWRMHGLQPRDGSFVLPVWDGSHLRGGHLLLWSEEKIGEEIMFSSMLRDVERRAGPVTLLCNPRIANLLGRAMPWINVKGWSDGAPPPVVPNEYAACYPLEFVGRFVRRSFLDFPAARPLLKNTGTPGVFPGRPTGEPSRPVIGLHWRSNNPFVGDYKSIPLRDWQPILSVPGIDFVSLQYGSVSAEIAEVQELFGIAPTMLYGVDQLVDMEAFTNVVSGLDLVISVSGTSAHVSGSLGRPTWVLLPRGPGLSWFWFEHRADSPWYPNCTLYRQNIAADWSGVLENVARDLMVWRDGYSS